MGDDPPGMLVIACHGCEVWIAHHPAEVKKNLQDRHTAQSLACCCLLACCDRRGNRLRPCLLLPALDSSQSQTPQGLTSQARKEKIAPNSKVKASTHQTCRHRHTDEGKET